MTHQIAVRLDELLQRRLDIVEQDIGDEAIDAGIDTGRLRPMYVTLRRNQMRQYRQIGEAARVSGLRRVAADALEVVALKIEFARFQKPRFVKTWMFAHQRVAER